MYQARKVSGHVYVCKGYRFWIWYYDFWLYFRATLTVCYSLHSSSVIILAHKGPIIYSSYNSMTHCNHMSSFLYFTYLSSLSQNKRKSNTNISIVPFHVILVMLMIRGQWPESHGHKGCSMPMTVIHISVYWTRIRYSQGLLESLFIHIDQNRYATMR